MFQMELLNVLDDFNVKTADDFYTLPPGERPYFVRRLYRAFVNEEDKIHNDLVTAGGVKFHFQTSGSSNSKSMNVPTSAFLNKLCFYSNRTLVSYPFKELRGKRLSRAKRDLPVRAWRESATQDSRPILFGEIRTVRYADSGYASTPPGQGYSLDPAAFRDFLITISQLRPAIETGLTYVIPAFPDKKRDFRRTYGRLTSANFSLPELKRQFLEEELVDHPGLGLQNELLSIHLPYFTNIPLERILEIRDHEQDLYNNFQRYLENLLVGLSPQETELKLLSVLRDIDAGVREIDRKFRSIKREYNRKDIFMGIGILCTGLAIFSGIEWGKEIAPMIASATGTATGVQFLSGVHDKKKAFESLSDDRFYLPWLIYRGKRN